MGRPVLGAGCIVGVCGAGAMGAGIAQIAAHAGHDVIVLDQNEDALAGGRETVAKGAAALVKRGRISEREAQALKARIDWTLEADALAKAGLVIEAIVEDAEMKRALFQRIAAIVSDKAVIATNTSSLSVTGLAAGLKRPARFLGLHFFNPAPVMKLVEVVSGAETDAAVAEGARAMMERWGKVAVIARDVPGFIVNRVARPFYGEGWRALEEGAGDAATLDFLYRDLGGFRMGPFELGDLVGHDVNVAAAKSVFDACSGRTRFTPSLMQARLVAAGRLGRKSGRGVYSYPEERPPAHIIQVEKDVADPALLGEIINGSPFDIEGVRVMASDGRPASAVAAATGKPVIVLDHLRDPSAASVIAFAGSGDAANVIALQFASRCGKDAVRLRDRPGLVVFRTLLQLANCAADAVRDGVAEPHAIDLAMINGVNYPFGPLAWAREYGFARVVAALDAIADETGEAMYRSSEWLRAAARGPCSRSPAAVQ